MQFQLDIFAGSVVPHKQAHVVDALGVLPPNADIETISWGEFKGLGWKKPLVSIQLAVHDDSRWMWAHSIYTRTFGSGYQVGPKWGKFATSRQAAISEAVREIRQRLGTSVSGKPKELDGLEAWFLMLETGFCAKPTNLTEN